ncbi:MAG: FemAB family PEP-CTERM system-associated protein, partial [Methyloversatilis sp.]|nr:FemAB family PEP-CTERM system-associated protein [Methyloversatilis sp.]
VAADNESASLALETEAQRIAQSLGVDHLEFRNVTARHADWPTEDLYVTFRKALLPEVEDNMKAIPRKQRAMVRKGIANGLKASFDADNARFFELYSDNVHRHGTPAMSRRYFDTLRATFGDRCSVMTVEAPDGTLLSSVMSFYFRDEILPYYAGDAEAARDLAANDFKYWELMRHACERGIKVFDYGRSKQGTGSYSFKKNWGFEPTPLHYEYCLYKRDSLPRNNPSNPKYKLMIEVWRRMPRSFANALGPFIVRNLG